MRTEPSQRQTIENTVFLRALGATGNAAMAARAIGMHRTTFIKRRRKWPGFAADWDAALVTAAAALAGKCGHRSPTPASANALRTSGGEITVRRGKNRPVQLRRARSGQLSSLGEQAFLAALASSANIRLAAEAAGISWSAIYRRRDASPAFAEAMGAALAIGYDRIEFAALERAAHSLGDRWDEGEGGAEWQALLLEENPLPPMTVEQALRLLHYHRATVKLGEQRRDKKRRQRSIEEVRASIMRKVAAIERARRREETGEGETETCSLQMRGKGATQGAL